MRAPIGPAILVAAAAYVFAFTAADARAYCRTRADTQKSGGRCQQSSAPVLYWTRGCVSYAFHADAFALLPLLTEAQVRAISAASFASWEEVNCGQTPFSVQQLLATTVTDPISFSDNRPNEFVLSVLPAAEWRRRKMDADAFAITYLWYGSESGEIFDVDMALNLTQGDFGNCDEPCRNSGPIDLQNTLTHEAGHVLGLGHSAVPGATMFSDATVGANFMRSLEEDDRLGVCALHLPSHECSAGQTCQCPTPPVISSNVSSQQAAHCAAHGALPASGAAPWLCALSACLAICGRRRLRRTSMGPAPSASPGRFRTP